ncbi:MAG: methionyl-tRNA formyltransferase [bacterium]
MRVVFCGNPDFALPTLDALHASTHKIAAVVCSPDKPMGRGLKFAPLPVKRRAEELDLEVLQPESLKDSGFLQQIARVQPDVLVVVAFRILPRELFTPPPQGAVNVHPSLLPKGRGPAPIHWTLLRGETETGVTIIRLTERIDAGNILRQERVSITPEDDFGSLHDRLAALGARMLVETLHAIENGTQAEPQKQDDSWATAAPKLKPEDFVLHWEKPALELRNQIRAFSPVPGAVTQLDGKRLKIFRVEVVAGDTWLSSGEVKTSGSEFFIGTGTVPLRILSLQLEGRKRMSAEEFLRGYRISDGIRFE